MARHSALAHCRTPQRLRGVADLLICHNLAVVQVQRETPDRDQRLGFGSPGFWLKYSLDHVPLKRILILVAATARPLHLREIESRCCVPSVLSVLIGVIDLLAKSEDKALLHFLSRFTHVAG